MTVPSKQSFEDFFEEIAWEEPFLVGYNHEEPENMICIYGDINREDINRWCSKAFSIADEHYRQFFSHKLTKFFTNQPGWILAANVLFRKNQQSLQDSIRRVREESLNNLYKILDEHHDSLEDRAAAVFELESKLKSIVNGDPCRVPRGIIRAFYNYYHTNRSKLVYEKSRKAERLISEAESLALEFKSIGDEFATSRKMIARFSEALEQEVPKFNFPITRNDRTAPERMLAYDLYILFRRSFRSSKLTAIKHLMSLEGVNRLSDRVIERKVSEWAKVKRN